jgi:hypothetical protein
MVVNDNACMLVKRVALELIVGTPPGASFAPTGTSIGMAHCAVFSRPELSRIV